MKTLRSIYLFTFCSALTLAIGSTRTLATEEQIVIEDLTPSQLRREIKKIQTEFYRVFNSSVEDKNLTIVCYNYTPTGSNIKDEACEPQFVIDKRGDNASDWQSGLNILTTEEGMLTELAAEYAALTAAMNEISTENEYFRELNGILGALREELESR
ncbi:MAG: hypothetical protein COA96_03855 [SAR86 cluster bacterium]|uniref:Uncharacterized protein n=1 Tax=SAR86 cluster bacterium TaxID=2030880 RepID=A0A2A5B7H4_9GAMM|nr:MAG: hypothetical protein COA96_03855 [SAR86 cluster bacterium]